MCAYTRKCIRNVCNAMQWKGRERNGMECMVWYGMVWYGMVCTYVCMSVCPFVGKYVGMLVGM